MFGELVRWNPAQELSGWHRNIDDLFGPFFGRPEGSTKFTLQSDTSPWFACELTSVHVIR
jgi:hypothetical protein